MLYHLLYEFLYPMSKYWSPLKVFNVVGYVTVRTVFASMTALLVSLLLGPWVIRRLTEFKIAVAPKTVRKGALITFAVTNKGTMRHNFKIAGKKTPLLAVKKGTTLKVTFAKAGRYTYLCTVPTHAAAGMKGVLTVK